jgi:hypothetical protein
MAKKGNGIFLVYTDIDAVHDDEFNAWYNTEHLPDLLRLPGFLDAARYVAVKGGPKYLAVYELATSDTLKSPEFQAYRANPTPWSRRISDDDREEFARTFGADFSPVPEAADRGLRPRFRSAGYRCLRASIASGMSGTTASTSPAIARFRE